MVASERRLVFAYHFPFQELGMRPRSVGGYTWEPIVWQFEAARNTNSCSVAAQS